jgi:two-component SAPR family response regulator
VFGKKTINSLGKHKGSGVNSKETHENWLKKTREELNYYLVKSRGKEMTIKKVTKA